MKIIIVRASMLPRTSFGIPWSSVGWVSGVGREEYVEGRRRMERSSPIVPAWEMKLFSIWENALHCIVSF